MSDVMYFCKPEKNIPSIFFQYGDQNSIIHCSTLELKCIAPSHVKVEQH
jgi:hypothetical protein